MTKGPMLSQRYAERLVIRPRSGQILVRTYGFCERPPRSLCRLAGRVWFDDENVF
jgi:hypothetical protein